MTDFSVGDKVRVRDTARLDGGLYNGKTGQVINAAPGMYIRVNLDDGTEFEGGLPLTEGELELIPEELVGVTYDSFFIALAALGVKVTEEQFIAAVEIAEIVQKFEIEEESND